jgi:hypothetical protein
MISDVQFSRMSWPARVCYMLGIWTLWQCRPVFIMKWRKDHLEKQEERADRLGYLLNIERGKRPPIQPPPGFVKATFSTK